MPLILRLCAGFVQHISKQMHITVWLVLLRSTAIYIGILTFFVQSTHIIEKHWLLVSLFNCFWFDLVLELFMKGLSHKFDFVAYRFSINIALLETEIYVFPKWYSHSFIHSVFSLTTGSKPPPKWFLHIVRSRASTFKWQYPVLSVRSSSSYLRLLPRLLDTSIAPFIFPSITCFRR